MPHRITRELQRLDIRIAHILEKEYSFKNAEDITGTNGQIIAFLLENENNPIYQKDIEKAFGITRSTASRVLSLMDKKNLIQRTSVAHDARLKRVTLTDRSREFAAAMLERCAELEKRLFSGFTPEEEELVLDLLKRMHKNLD